MDISLWHGKPYYSLDAYCKNNFGEKRYKIAVNAGMTCPNRDGTLGNRGCIFCSAGGSGDFAVDFDSLDLSGQLSLGLSLFGDKSIGNHYIAYFQAYTNTYGPISYLRKVYETALNHPSVCGISIATRPDCLSDDIYLLLDSLKQTYVNKFIWIELGLQTIHSQTAKWMRRGYELDCFDEACNRLHSLNLPFIVHIILGLPGENSKQILQTIQYLNDSRPFGVKLQLLHILKGTDLEKEYLAFPFSVYSLEEYIDILIQCLEHLSPDVVVHRVTGDGPKDLLIAPTWSLNKRNVLNTLHTTMKKKRTYQGRCFHDARSIDFI